MIPGLSFKLPTCFCNSAVHFNAYFSVTINDRDQMGWGENVVCVLTIYPSVWGQVFLSYANICNCTISTNFLK